MAVHASVAGLVFELEGYIGCTLEAMCGRQAPRGVPNVKLEDIAKDFDSAMTEVFRHLGPDRDGVRGGMPDRNTGRCSAHGRGPRAWQRVQKIRREFRKRPVRRVHLTRTAASPVSSRDGNQSGEQQ